MICSSDELLRRLGSGESIADVCRVAEMSREAFDRWWSAQLRGQVPTLRGTSHGRVGASVRIDRDGHGIPSIYADDDHDLYFGFGYAQAQDRLFQLDYLRRKGAGRLAEILGPDGVESDIVARTVGFPHIASAHWKRLRPESRALLEAFAQGINAYIDDTRGTLPIEFCLLDYKPEPWTAVDCMIIERDAEWYRTGRLQVVVYPELARRTLGEGALLEEFLLGEADEETIIPSSFSPHGREGVHRVGRALGQPFDSMGSNNWAVSGERSASGKPLACSDPHLVFSALPSDYEVRLCGGSFNSAGISFAGVPVVRIGRNEHVAWVSTNNICSQRDLYAERTNPDHPSCFLYGDQWEPELTLEEVILVKGEEPITKTIRFSRNGPIVNEILPLNDAFDEPISLRWVGRHEPGWMEGLLAMNHARSVPELIEASRDWNIPTQSSVFADRDGHIAYRTNGRIPIRKNWTSGFRPGWDPEHDWEEYIPFESLPELVDPPRGWVASANNRVVADDFPYPLSGTWSSGHRMRRIRAMMEASSAKFTLDDMMRMHFDTKSLRAEECVPVLLKIVGQSDNERARSACDLLASWDFRIDPNLAAPTVFNVFFDRWTRTVVGEHFKGEIAEALAGAALGVASRLLVDDRAGWFCTSSRGRMEAILETFQATIDELTEKYGDDPSEWRWSRHHKLELKHPLSGRGNLGELLNQESTAVPGDGTTVCNTGYGDDGEASWGAAYRVVIDLASDPPALHAHTAASQSGNPGSPYYADQLHDWLAMRYHEIVLKPRAAVEESGATWTIDPKS